MAEVFTVFIDPDYNAGERQAIGNAIVNYIFNRTSSGRGINNVPFTRKDGSQNYSEAYQEHKHFGIAGKNAGPINLQLTGDMLSSIEVLDISLAGRIIIGIKDDQNAEKARWMREKGYNFLGISNSEQQQILRDFSKLTPQQIRRDQVAENLADEFLKELFRNG